MIDIRKITETDLSVLADLLEELTQTPTDRDKMRHNFRWMESHADYIVLGAFEQEKLVGSLMGIVCRDLAGDCRPFLVIENVIVSSKCRGKGIGRLLMRAIEKAGRQRNCYYAIFVSSVKRKEAHKFYESIGYRLNEVQGFKKFL